jgi:hypothetical protein
MRRSRIFPEVATQEFGLWSRYVGLAKSNSSSLARWLGVEEGGTLD